MPQVIGQGSGIVRPAGIALSRGSAPIYQVFCTTPGNFTWTVPAGVTDVSILCIGGGGGGGSADSNSSNNGGDGGDSIVRINSTIVCRGDGGQNGQAARSSSATRAGGAGGSNNIGDATHRGGDGGDVTTMANEVGAGGGGGAAGMSGSGGDAGTVEDSTGNQNVGATAPGGDGYSYGAGAWDPDGAATAIGNRGGGWTINGVNNIGAGGGGAAFGSSGGSDYLASGGGGGGCAVATIPVTPGTVLEITVGNYGVGGDNKVVNDGGPGAVVIRTGVNTIAPAVSIAEPSRELEMFAHYEFDE